MNSVSTNPLRLMIVAGEASGDAHAAALVRALRAAAPEIQFEFFGSTGAQMRAAGVDSVVRRDDLAILGLWEIGRALPKFWRAFSELKRAAVARNPDAVILVDWPDFNLRLAHWLHRRGFRVVYYISPQLWAWRPYRARGVRRVRASGDREEFCRRHNLDPSRPIVALLPGSRHKELIRILPPMLDAAILISRERSGVQFVLVVAPNRDLNEAQEIVSADRFDSLRNRLRIVHSETREALAAADVAGVCSGTATLEAALLTTPMVIVYKESFLNWHLLGSLITADHYGLVNLIAGRRVAPELMQNELNGERLAQELLALLDPDRNRAARDELLDVSEKLGESGASLRAARAILEFIKANVSEARP